MNDEGPGCRNRAPVATHPNPSEIPITGKVWLMSNHPAKGGLTMPKIDTLSLPDNQKNR